MATDQLYQQSEVVRPKLQPWLNSFPVASNLVEKGEVERIGERDYRIPVKLQNAGRYGTMNKDGGAYGRGNAMAGDKMISTFFTTRMNAELTQLAKDATANKPIAIVSAFNDAVKGMMEHYHLQEDFSFHTDGTAVMATPSAYTTSGGNSIYTMEGNLKASWVRRGQLPVIYATAYGSIRTSSLYVKSIDFKTGKVTMNGTVPGGAATDIFCFEGVTGTGAAPAWKKGLGYFINSSTSSTILGLSQATEPEVQSNFINVAGTISWQAGMALLDMIDDRRPQTSSKLVGLCNRAQRAQIMIQEMQISRWDRKPGKENPIDLLPNIGMESFPFCGRDVMIDPQLDRSKLIFWDPKSWGKARLTDLHWVETSDGKRFYPLYSADGSPSAAEWFAMTLDEDWYCFDIATTGLLYGLTLPSNY